MGRLPTHRRDWTYAELKTIQRWATNYYYTIGFTKQEQMVWHKLRNHLLETHNE